MVGDEDPPGPGTTCSCPSPARSRLRQRHRLDSWRRAVRRARQPLQEGLHAPEGHPGRMVAVDAWPGQRWDRSIPSSAASLRSEVQNGESRRYQGAGWEAAPGTSILSPPEHSHEAGNMWNPEILEALTESFCERCGTPSVHGADAAEPAAQDAWPGDRAQDYIMQVGRLSDSVGDAMRSEEDELAAAHLEAFQHHVQFYFSVACTACTNCWNDSAGRCRSCAPVAGTDDLLERFEATFAAGHQPVADAPMSGPAGGDGQFGVAT